MNNIIQNIIHKFFNNSQPSTDDILFKKWLLSPKNREEKDQAISEIWDSCQNETPDAFTLSELETFHRNNFLPGKRANFRSTIYKAVATILLPILGALFTWLILDTPQDTEQLIECFVPKGEKAKQIFLPDGSEVWVNAESILIYPNTFKGDTRTLFLNGEANFKVSRDKKKPFIVKTATLDIEALGTTFNVESYSNSPQTIATLEEGKIKISTKDSIPHETILSPNEQFIYDSNTHSREINIVDAQRLSNWRTTIFQKCALRETGKNDRKKIQRNDSLRPRKIQKQQAHCKIRPRRNDRRSIIHFGRDTAKHEIQKK